MAYCSIGANEYRAVVDQTLRHQIAEYFEAGGIRTTSFGVDTLYNLMVPPVLKLYPEFCQEKERVLYSTEEVQKIKSKNRELKSQVEPFQKQIQRNNLIYGGLFVLSTATVFFMFKKYKT